VLFFGHSNVRSLHTRTIEVTKEKSLSTRGDCIIGVGANKACSELSDSIKHKILDPASLFVVEISVGQLRFTTKGHGDSRLTLTHKHDMVLRKTAFVCPRTLLVTCDKSSADVPRQLVRALQDPLARGIMRITTE
jgi:hypothetical protein